MYVSLQPCICVHVTEAGVCVCSCLSLLSECPALACMLRIFDPVELVRYMQMFRDKFSLLYAAGL